jgi:phage shock protein A
MTPKPEPDARVVDDKVAAAHERAEQIENLAGQATQSDTEPSAPSVGDLGAAPSAEVDHLTTATQNLKAAEEKLKQQSAELKRKIDEAKKATCRSIHSSAARTSSGTPPTAVSTSRTMTRSRP